MTTISDKDRAEAQAMYEALAGCTPLAALSDNGVRGWLAVRDHVLAAHECPTVPVWRPTTADEIQPGWEVRARYSDGMGAKWGTAHHQGDDGDWRSEEGARLTYDACGWTWTYETTAPLPEPEPWDDDTLDEWEDALRSTIDLDAGWTTSTRAVLNLLAERGLIERPKAGV